MSNIRTENGKIFVSETNEREFASKQHIEQIIQTIDRRILLVNQQLTVLQEEKQKLLDVLSSV